MTSAQNNSQKLWPVPKAFLLSLVCLVIGLVAGWFLHFPKAAPADSATKMATTAAPHQPSVKELADANAAPILDQLKANPDQPELLTQVGNIYYDAQQYATAADFYQHVLKLQPKNVGVRTDMATAEWYQGDADTAITEFKKALTYEPTNPNALFNLGIVEWKGKQNAIEAVAAWKKLLATNPTYAEKDKVNQMISEAQQGKAKK